jgi:hypothetical protein
MALELRCAPQELESDRKLSDVLTGGASAALAWGNLEIGDKLAKV